MLTSLYSFMFCIFINFISDFSENTQIFLKKYFFTFLERNIKLYYTRKNEIKKINNKER